MGAGERIPSKIFSTYFFQVFAAQAICPSGAAPACQESEVGGQPSREPEPLVLAAASNTECPFLEALGRDAALE